MDASEASSNGTRTRRTANGRLLQTGGNDPMVMTFTGYSRRVSLSNGSTPAYGLNEVVCQGLMHDVETRLQATGGDTLCSMRVLAGSNPIQYRQG